MTDDRDKDEVKSMFQLLLDGQQKQQKTSEAFERKVVTNLGDLRQKAHAKNDLTTGRLDSMATTMTDFNGKLHEGAGGKVRWATRWRGSSGECRRRGRTRRMRRTRRESLAYGSLGPAESGHRRVELTSTEEGPRGARTTALGRVERRRGGRHLQLHKRAQVAYAIFKNQRGMISFIAWTRAEKPRTFTEGDDDTIWAKVSQPPELQARTLPLSSAARAIYAYFENANLPRPWDMVVDYHRNGIVVENYVIVSVKGLSDIMRHANVRARRVPNAPMEEVKAAAKAFSAPRG